MVSTLGLRIRIVKRGVYTAQCNILVACVTSKPYDLNLTLVNCIFKVIDLYQDFNFCYNLPSLHIHLFGSTHLPLLEQSCNSVQLGDPHPLPIHPSSHRQTSKPLQRPCSEQKSKDSQEN